MKSKTKNKEKPVEKLFKNSIVYGTLRNYDKIEFRLTFEQMIDEKGDEGKLYIQHIYNNVKKRLKKGQRILNKKSLKEMGVNV